MSTGKWDGSKRMAVCIASGILIAGGIAFGDFRAMKGKNIMKNGYNISGRPDYSQSERELPIGAYCGPRKAGTEWLDGEETVLHHVSYVTDEGFQDFVDAGLSYVFAEYDCKYERRDTDEVDTYMKLAEKYGVDVYVLSDRMTKLLRQEGDTLTEDEKEFVVEILDYMKRYKSCKGLMMADEPGLAWLDKYTAATDYMKTLKQDLKPLCAGLPLAYYFQDISVYPGMIDSLSNSFGEFLYDFYPFTHSYNWKNEETYWTHDYWFQNLQIVAERCKGKCDAGVTIQSHGAGELRDVGLKEVSFQAYTALAYGMKRLGYYTYWEHFSQSTKDRFTSAMVVWDDRFDPDSKAHKTETYYAVQKVNQEILKFDHVYMNFDWQGTQVLREKDSAGLLTPIPDYESPRIVSLSGSDDVIVGCLKDQKAYDGFMLVNATDPSDDLSVEGDIYFRDADRAIVYIHGEESEVPLVEGSYHYLLESGQGIFMIPYME